MKKIILILTLLFVASCAKEEFTTPKQDNTYSTPNVSITNDEFEASMTYVQPPVDILFVWDNSTSTNFLGTETKAALNNIVNNISNRFDYHVMIAPLVQNSGEGINSRSYFFSKDGLVPGTGITTINPASASSVINYPQASGSYEAGLTRVRDLLKVNQSNGVFRKDSYTIIVMMSNDDDNSWATGNFSNPLSDTATKYQRGKVHDILCMRGNYDGQYYSNSSGTTWNAACSGSSSYELNSIMMRFVSITAAYEPRTANCPQINNGKTNTLYRNTSRDIFWASYTNMGNSFPFEPAYVPNEDKVDICYTSNFTTVFDHVNSVITDAIIAHSYNYIKIADSYELVDPETIVVYKGSYPNLIEIPEYSGSGSGFEYVGVNTFNTRYSPTLGEQKTGHMIRLHGSARLTYPEKISFTFNEPKSYYGYVHMAGNPVESSIVLKINGATIPKSTSNGWELIGYRTNQNIKIVSPTDDSFGSPPEYKTGYFLKLHGNAIYSDGADVNVNYHTTGN